MDVTDRTWWNTEVKELSDYLWFPDIAINYKKIGYKTNSWFKIEKFELPKNAYRSNIEFPEYNVPFSSPVYRTEQIKLFPTKSQRKILLSWMNICRYVFNLVNTKIKQKSIVTYDNRKIRNIIKPSLDNWIRKVPSHILDETINSLCTAYKGGFNSGHIFDIGFKKKMDLQYTINIPADCFTRTHNTFCSSKLGDNIKSSVPLIDETNNKIDTCCTLTYHRILKTWILGVPRYKTIEEREEIDNNNYISIDSGSRTFQTCFCKDHYIKIGNHANHKVRRIHKQIDKLKHLKDTAISNKQKKKYQKPIHRKYSYLKNLIKDMHYKTANFITKNHKYVYLGKLETSDIMKSNLNRKAKRELQSLRHYIFQQIMKRKCAERNIMFKEVDECLTTKTCGNCGHINRNIGSAEIYNCSECYKIIERDINSSRSMFLKSVTIVNNE